MGFLARKKRRKEEEEGKKKLSVPRKYRKVGPESSRRASALPLHDSPFRSRLGSEGKVVPNRGSVRFHAVVHYSNGGRVNLSGDGMERYDGRIHGGE